MNLTIQLQPARMRDAFFGAAALLVLAHSIGLGITWLTGHDRLFGLIPLFRLNHENNIPTWFASFVLLTISALALFISFSERNREGRFWKHWFSIGVVFLMFSIDETASMHELLTLRCVC